MTAQDRRDKFVTLAEKRVIRTLKDLRLIANLANRSNYIYTDDDVSRIFAAIDKEVREAKSHFKATDEKNDLEFSLPRQQPDY